MTNFFDDNQDMQWYLNKGIDWEPLVKLTEYGYKTEDGFKNADEALEFYRDVLQLVGDFTIHSGDLLRENIEIVALQ